MTESYEPECWEDVEQLTLNPVPVTATRKCDEDDTTMTTIKETTSTEPPPQKGDTIDQALKEALKNPRERANVLRIDADVFKFISDKTRCTIEFSYDLTSYQRLLAHRVSQMYGLQTSSVPLGNGLSRVIAHKTQETKAPPVRVVEVMNIYCPPESAKKAAPPEVTIKRREGMATGGGGGPSENHTGSLHSTSSGQSLSVKQREEEYKAARDRILGETPHAESEERPSADEPEDDGKNTKAVFRDRAKELQDPDYRRGGAKTYQKALYDERSNYGPETKRMGTGGGGGVYNAPTYHSEFPALPGATAPPPQPYPHHPYHPNVSMGERAAAAAAAQQFQPPVGMNYPMANAMPRQAMPYPPPYAYPPQARTAAPYRMEPPSGTTQPLPALWKFPPAVSTPAAPTLARPPQLYPGYPSYPSYPSYPPYPVRSPYIAVAQGNQQVSAPMDGSGHLHQMTTIRRKPVSHDDSDDRTPANR